MTDDDNLSVKHAEVLAVSCPVCKARTGRECKEAGTQMLPHPARVHKAWNANRAK